MEILGIDLIGVAAATVVGMILGAFWYSPVAFGKQWMDCLGKTAEELGSTALPMIGSIVASLLSAIGLSIIFLLVGVDSLEMGVYVGLTLGLLIIFPALLSDNLFCGWGARLLLIQSGYRASSIVLMSIALVYLG